MTLARFRKDGAAWDIALVAVLLNVFLQLGCCMGPASGPDGFSLSDPLSWCSIDKADASAQGQSDSGDSHTEDCSDCRQCTGQAAVVAMGLDRVVLAAVPNDPVSITPVIAPTLSLVVVPYEGRGPPLILRT